MGSGWGDTHSLGTSPPPPPPPPPSPIAEKNMTLGTSNHKNHTFLGADCCAAAQHSKSLVKLLAKYYLGNLQLKPMVSRISAYSHNTAE